MSAEAQIRSGQRLVRRPARMIPAEPEPQSLTLEVPPQFARGLGYRAILLVATILALVGLMLILISHRNAILLAVGTTLSAAMVAIGSVALTFERLGPSRRARRLRQR